MLRTLQFVAFIAYDVGIGSDFVLCEVRNDPNSESDPFGGLLREKDFPTLIDYKIASHPSEITEAYRVLFKDEPVCDLVDWRLHGPAGGARAVIAHDAQGVVGMSTYLSSEMLLSGRCGLAYQAVELHGCRTDSGCGISQILPERSQTHNLT